MGELDRVALERSALEFTFTEQLAVQAFLEIPRQRETGLIRRAPVIV
jgi:hypothetical protein